MLKKNIFICLILALNFKNAFSQVKKVESKKPKLIVVMIIDQFRADYLLRFKDRFLPAKLSNGSVGGFNYLLSNGAYFPYAQYDILQSMTGPGHATLLTGSYPYQSGIPLNDWYDTKLNKNVYCVEDEKYEIVGSTELKDRMGMSPKNLIGSTFGDELKNAGFPSKVVAISLKDRSAILLGGHRSDLSLWFDPKSFQWVSSKYYLPEGKLPTWVDTLNKEVAIKKTPMKIWSAKLQETMKSYFKTTSNYPADNKLISKIGPAFNHGIAACSPEELSSPYGIELTAQAALRAVDNFKLGQNVTPDLLAISFSSHDYVGHAFGPNSKEIEDMTVSEDRAFSTFFNQLKAKIPGGLSDVVFVLSADHGVAPNSDWMIKNKMNAGRIDIVDLKNKIENKLNETYGKSENGDWILYNVDFNYFLNRNTINQKKLNLSDVELEIKKILLDLNIFQFVFTHQDYLNKNLPPQMFERQINKTYFTGRSGDIIAIPKPYFVHNDDNTTTHMTSYSYDRTVPLIFVGSRIKPGIYPKIADIVDLAPTLSFISGVLPPSSSEGKILSEIFKN
jgi:predicted AlkP superfamily pyrophosphatase or phosphodiesterase